MVGVHVCVSSENKAKPISFDVAGDGEWSSDSEESASQTIKTSRICTEFMCVCENAQLWGII